MSALTTARELAADVEILEQYDRARSYKGHDYGAGQRAAELSRRRRELRTFCESSAHRIEEIELTCLTTDEPTADEVRAEGRDPDTGVLYEGRI